MNDLFNLNYIYYYKVKLFKFIIYKKNKIYIPLPI